MYSPAGVRGATVGGNSIALPSWTPHRRMPVSSDARDLCRSVFATDLGAGRHGPGRTPGQMRRGFTRPPPGAAGRALPTGPQSTLCRRLCCNERVGHRIEPLNVVPRTWPGQPPRAIPQSPRSVSRICAPSASGPHPLVSRQAAAAMAARGRVVNPGLRRPASPWRASASSWVGVRSFPVAVPAVNCS